MSKAIEVTNLVKRYKELVALDHFNLDIEEVDEEDEQQ